ncbi:uncharacterized protein [Euwallacea similis]|uniref:uncharacterized protein n=1 Tax=Euwallacea similis TaxID=1736056 RepID=UPI00344E6457
MTNGKVERCHRTLKAAIMAYAIERWTEVLLTILLGLHATLRDEIGVSPAEMLYGTLLRLPGEFFEAVQLNTDPTSFVSKLKQKMQLLQPVPPTDHSRRKIFVAPEINTCTHVFVRNDAVKKPLQPPYEGPFPVKSRADKYFTVLINHREINISKDRLKPAFILAQDPTSHDHSYAKSNPIHNPSKKRVRFNLR